MRKLLILSALALAIVALSFEATVHAQAPPAYIGAGALFQNGGKTEFVMQVDLNANLMRGSRDSGQVTTSQIYLSGRFFYADDVGLDSTIAQELEALGGFVVGEVIYKKMFIATGLGPITELEDGQNPWRVAFLLEGGWIPISRIRVSIGGVYIPIPDMGDLVYVGAGVGLQF